MPPTKRRASSPFEAGVAREIITPRRGLPLHGYFNPRYNRGVLDHLYVKVVLLRDGQRHIGGVVSYDLCFVSRPVVARVRARLKSQGCPFGDRLIFCATHTHTGPHVIPLFETRADPSYVSALISRSVAAIKRAHANLCPAVIRVGSVNKNPFAFNRRYFMKDGRVVTNPGKLNPDIVRPEGPVDREIGLLTVEQDGMPRAILANITNHTDTIGADMVSADWPGQMEKFIQHRLGQDVLVVTLTGPEGNINHFDVKSRRNQTCYGEAKRIGAGYGGIVLNAARKLKPLRARSLRVGRTQAVIAYQTVTAEQVREAKAILRKKGKGRTGNLTSEDLARGDLAVAKYFARQLIQFHRQCSGRRRTFDLVALKFGKSLGIVSVPGEPFTQVGLAIKRGSPFERTFVAALGHGACGYVPMPECFERGGYEILPVVDGGPKQDTAGLLIEKALEALE